MPFNVLLVEDAERDIADIWRCVAVADGTEKADQLIDALEDACSPAC
jgi:plasmid stabilization system protein ParE